MTRQPKARFATSKVHSATVKLSKVDMNALNRSMDMTRRESMARSRQLDAMTRMPVCRQRTSSRAAYAKRSTC
jgi:hypothetical protein